MPQPSPPARTSDLPDLPPPAPSAGALAWLRWTIAVLKATTGPNRVAIRRHHAPTGGTESLGTVAIAISTDLAMSVAKAVAAGADLQADGREDPADGVVGSPGHDDDPDDHEGAESEQ